VFAKVLEKRGERIIRVQVVLITASGPLGEKPLVFEKMWIREVGKIVP